MATDATEEQGAPELPRVRRAVVVVDIVESVRLMQQHEDEVIRHWQRFVHDARTVWLPAHGGRMVKSLGDGMLLVFDTARAAVACAGALREGLTQRCEDPAMSEPLRLRIGVHFAEVVIDEFDIYGTAVNLAARLAGVAGPDEIVASVEVVDQIVPGLDADLDDLGDCYFKHVVEPMRVYRLAIPARGHFGFIELAGASRSEGAPGAELPRPKVAVLTLDGTTEVLALSSLIADEIAIQLSVHSTIDLISRMSTRHVEGVEQGALLRRLGAHYAISGSCAAIGGRVLVTLELVFALDLRVVWSRAVGASQDDLVADPAAFLHEISQDIMEAIEANETGRARSLPLASLGSYSLLIGGVRLMHRLSQVDFQRARSILEGLVARHPRHPDGYAWLAKWHILQLHQGWSSDALKSAGMARDMARRALDLDDHCGVAMVISGMVKTYNDRRLDEAERIYQAALDANPNDAMAWLLKGTMHAFRGEGELAVRHARRASELSPLDPIRYYFDSLGASAEAAAGNYEQAVALARRSLRANALHASTLRILTIAYAMLDRMDEAREIVQRMLILEPDFSVQRFLARSPAADFPIGRTFANALERSGVPR